MNAFEVLDLLEKTSSRLEKEKILTEAKDDKTLRLLFERALNPYKTYGIAKFKKPIPHPVVWDSTYGDFFQTLHWLETRQLTGGAAKFQVEKVFSFLTQLEQKWCERILLKNLRCGASEETILKIWPGLYPTFSVQLAGEVAWKHTPAKDDFIITSKINYPVWVDPKFDGHRLIAIKKDGVVSMRSRGGQVIETYPTIVKQLEALKVDNFVFDGEVIGVGAEGWNDAQSVGFSTVNKKDDSKMGYNVFDGMTLSEWEAQKCDLPYIERLKVLLVNIPIGLPNVLLVYTQGRTVHNEEYLREFYTECLDRGFEGIMLKDLQGKYVFDRGSSIQKLKPWTTWEGVVVGFYDGNKNTKWEEKHCGGYIVRLPNGIDTRVGNGYKDADREEMHQDNLKAKVSCQLVGSINSWMYTSGMMLGKMGCIMETKGQPPLSKDGRIRFPVFKRWRAAGDVDPKVLAIRDALGR
jgi:DNA ligase-1